MAEQVGCPDSHFSGGFDPENGLLCGGHRCLREAPHVIQCPECGKPMRVNPDGRLCPYCGEWRPYYVEKGLDRLQAGLDAHEEPEDWPDDVCRDAWCGHWERNNGQYFWHRPGDFEGHS